MSVCLTRYYPFHYAPFLSDIRNIAGLKLTFDLGKPFMPFQQLLAVLPAASMELLPQAYRVTHTLSHTHMICDTMYGTICSKMAKIFIMICKYYGLCKIQTRDKER